MELWLVQIVVAVITGVVGPVLAALVSRRRDRKPSGNDENG